MRSPVGFGSCESRISFTLPTAVSVNVTIRSSFRREISLEPLLSRKLPNSGNFYCSLGTPRYFLDVTLPHRMLQSRGLPANPYVPATDCKFGTSALTYEWLERRSSLPSLRPANPGQNQSGAPDY